MIDDTHVYNLKAVMHEVGLSAATLRAWERRYGLLKPLRSAGGQRLYSRQDIEMLKWLVNRQNEGLSISRAVEMWNTSYLGQIHTPVPEISTGGVMIDILRDQWITACKVFDDQAANRTLDQAFAIAAPETICTQVLQKGLAQIGEGWYTGTISVQQEHFASVVATRRINNLLAAAAPPTRSGHILAACPPGEMHEFALLMVAYLLRRGGWDVVYLGSNVPLNDLDATIQSTQPALMLSAAQTLESAASLRKMSEYLVAQEVPLAFGGGVFIRAPGTIKSITGYYLGTDLALVPPIIELLIVAPPSMPITQPVSLEYAQTLERFQLNETLIIDSVVSAMQSKPVEPAHLAIANTNFTRMISSALILGDINLLNPSITWLNGLLINYSLSTSLVKQFYSAYTQAVERYLGDEGAILQDWLTKLQFQE